MNFLFLYTEIAGYLLAGLKALHQEYGVECHVVRWPVSKEAPFDFSVPVGVTLYDRSAFTQKKLESLIQKVNPSLIFVSGWSDRGYNSLIRKVDKNRCPVVCSMDNHWQGSLRQQLAVLGSPFLFKSRYSVVWVPGLPQYEYARKLGFGANRIKTGLYSADLHKFLNTHDDSEAIKLKKYPKQLLFVGRLVHPKGVDILIDAFQSLADDQRNGWKLRLVGADPERKWMNLDHPDIEIVDFVQPNKLPSLARKAGAFVLPSRFEPWGVVLHEFAAAGLPLLASDRVGSATAFLRSGYNGLIFKSDDVRSLKESLTRLFSLSTFVLNRWGKRSRELSLQITPESWAATLMSVVDEYRD